MALRLYVATTSQGKLRDFRTAAAAHTLDLEPLPGIEAIAAPEEDGATFAANATLKAVYYSRFAPGELVLADDSGLEVDALNGAPGVRSARFAADAGVVDSPDANDNTDVWNNLRTAARLAGVPAAQRTARYRCVLVAARDGTALHTAEGAVEGLILECAARHGRIRLRPTVLPARARPHHGRGGPGNQALAQPSRPRHCGTAADAGPMTFQLLKRKPIKTHGMGLTKVIWNTNNE